MFLSDDDMVECPYNKTHRMLRKRLQSHLLKCRLNYPDVELRKCPFNITHLIPEPEFTHHATNCPDRKLITQYKYDAPQRKEDDGPTHAPVECEENWDDTDVNDYNPRLYLDKANVIRKPDGANRSERKLFIKKERKRLGDGDESSDEDCKSSVSSFDNKNSVDNIEDFRKAWSRSNRSTSPSSSFSKNRCHSPTTKSKRHRPRSPVDFKRSYGDSTRSGSPDYSHNAFSTGNNFNSPKDPYYIRRGRNADNSQYNNGQEYANDNDEMQSMPEAPPPPMISYPAPGSYFGKKSGQ